MYSWISRVTWSCLVKIKFFKGFWFLTVISLWWIWFGPVLRCPHSILLYWSKITWFFCLLFRCRYLELNLRPLHWATSSKLFSNQFSLTPALKGLFFWKSSIIFKSFFSTFFCWFSWYIILNVVSTIHATIWILDCLEISLPKGYCVIFKFSFIQILRYHPALPYLSKLLLQMSCKGFCTTWSGTVTTLILWH